MPDVLARPRFRGGIEPRLTADDRLFLLRDAGGGDLLIERDGAWTAALLRLADGRRSPAELGAARPGAGRAGDAATVGEALGALAAEDVLVDASGDDDGVLAPELRARFDRQLAYFGQLAPPVDAARAQAALRDVTICVLGLGGLGSWTAWALACCGVGTIVGVDGDRLELSNLNRQVLYLEDDVGRSKAHAAGRLLRRFDSGLRYRAVDRRLGSAGEVAEVIAGADLVVDAADWPPHRLERWVNAACFAQGVPFLTMSQQPPVVRVGPLYVPGATGCYACQEAAWREEHPLYDELASAEQPFAPATTFGPACAAIGGLAASEAVHHLTGLRPAATVGTAILLDTETYAVDRRPLARRAGCEVCG